MLAACHEAQAEARLIEDKVRGEEQDQSDQHKPVELEAADVYDQSPFRLHVLDSGGYVVGIFRDVDGLYNDSCKSSCQHVHSSADQCLVCAEVDARYAQERGIDQSHEHGGQDHQQDDDKSGSACGEILHDQCAAQGTHDHNSFKAEVDNTGVLGEAAAECDQHQNGRK